MRGEIINPNSNIVDIEVKNGCLVGLRPVSTRLGGHPATNGSQYAQELR